MFSRDDQEKQLAIIKESKLTVYEEAGHGAQWEEPERFVTDLLDYIKDQ